MTTQESEQTASEVELTGIKQRFLQITKQQGWATQSDIAAKLGVHERTISSIATAERLIGTRTLLAMLKHDLDIAYLLTGNQSKSDSMTISALEQRVAVLESTIKSILLISHQAVPNNKIGPVKLQAMVPEEPPQPKLTPEQLQIIAKYESAPAQIKAALKALLGNMDDDALEANKSV